MTETKGQKKKDVLFVLLASTRLSVGIPLIQGQCLIEARRNVFLKKSQKRGKRSLLGEMISANDRFRPVIMLEGCRGWESLAESVVPSIRVLPVMPQGPVPMCRCAAAPLLPRTTSKNAPPPLTRTPPVSWKKKRAVVFILVSGKEECYRWASKKNIRQCLILVVQTDPVK